MKTINTNQIIDPLIQQPFDGKSLAFLQGATKEVIASIVKGMLGYDPTTTPVALYGCKETDLGGGFFDYSEGYLYWNGEIYYFPAVSGINFSIAKAVGRVTTQDPTADPVNFFDGSTKYVHDIVSMVISDSAGGDFIYSTIIHPFIRTKIIPLGTWDMQSVATINIAHGLDYTKILDVRTTIYFDLPITSSLPIEFLSTTEKPSGAANVYNATDIQIQRTATGVFNSALFSLTTANRGFLTITFID